MKLEVFDPPMCCSSGVCGVEIDPELIRLSSLLDTLKGRGVEVYRYNLAQEPMAFVQNELVRATLTEDDKCLPIVLLDGRVVSRGGYPTDTALTSLIAEEGAPHVA